MITIVLMWREVTWMMWAHKQRESERVRILMVDNIFAAARRNVIPIAVFTRNVRVDFLVPDVHNPTVGIAFAVPRTCGNK